MPTISVTQLARNLADTLNRVAYRGERFTVVKGSRPVAEIGPAPRGRPLSELRTVLAALPRLGAEDAERFGADVERARTESLPPPGDPWAS
jgi:antitoxin (DNA-binding transcriptional repressor) of toxin-antitoxin stability system